ncbi:MAG: Maf family protein [Pseudomonadota bacterium]
MRRAELVLASASPRRAQLLRQLGFEFRVDAQDIDESRRPGEPPRDYVSRMADEKREALLKTGERAALILAADTVVVQQDRIYGKPADRAQCVEMLAALSASRHEVMTAVSVGVDDQSQSAVVESSVWFRAITRAEAGAYWDTQEPRDKAGSYAIQGLGAAFARRLEGSYSAVMGLPAFEVCQLLADYECVPGWQRDNGQSDG